MPSHGHHSHHAAHHGVHHGVHHGIRQTRHPSHHGSKQHLAHGHMGLVGHTTHQDAMLHPNQHIECHDPHHHHRRHHHHTADYDPENHPEFFVDPRAVFVLRYGPPTEIACCTLGPTECAMSRSLPDQLSGYISHEEYKEFCERISCILKSTQVSPLLLPIVPLFLVTACILSQNRESLLHEEINRFNQKLMERGLYWDKIKRLNMVYLAQLMVNPTVFQQYCTGMGVPCPYPPKGAVYGPTASQQMHRIEGLVQNAVGPDGKVQMVPVVAVTSGVAPASPDYFPPEVEPPTPSEPMMVSMGADGKLALVPFTGPTAAATAPVIAPVAGPPSPVVAPTPAPAEEVPMIMTMGPDGKMKMVPLHPAKKTVPAPVPAGIVMTLGRDGKMHAMSTNSAVAGGSYNKVVPVDSDIDEYY